MFDRKEHLKRIANKIEFCKCSICKRDFKKISAFGSHLRFEHKMSSEEYYDKFINVDCLNLCICGNKKSFNSIHKGYNRYCGMKCSEKGKGSDNPMHGKSYKNQKHSDFMKINNPMKNKEISSLVASKIRGTKRTLSDDHKQKIRKHLQENIISKGLNINNGAKCKFFVINNIKVQGRYELAFITDIIIKDGILPSRGKTIKTPYGFYTPDFEFEDYFVEIKSTYTIKTCKKSSQFDKIKWVSDNIKIVKIKLLTERKVKDILSKSIK